MSVLPTNYLTPSGREEAWRFTPLKRIAGLHDPSTTVADRISIELIGNARPGFSISKVKAADLPAKSSTDDAVIQRVRAGVAEVTHLQISQEAVVTEPIVLARKAGNGGEFSRTVITAGAHSKATVIVENAGEATIGEEIELRLEAGSNLTFISLQEWSANSVHLGRHHAIVGRDATFNSITVTIGGSLVRLLPTVEYSDQGGSAELLGLYFATDGQHLEHRVHVDHGIPNAKSRVTYKGVLAGDQARTVWIGDVFIRGNAEGTDTYELNKNLLLTDGARADSVPNLEIETGEIVGAGHASTTGRFDDEQLFYLMSRGIPMADARRLVIRGFFTEIINKIGNEVIEERLMSRIDAQLEKVGA
ncbi:MAG: Fe-S cluster assembly protein SufD [Candidatus Nanopelagicaceae bacterium]|nr:Fe-S cluster assembly protein SufD [Candidatus Nanopelagicaceae bacterium]